jgi:hypothetical protein
MRAANQHPKMLKLLSLGVAVAALIAGAAQAEVKISDQPTQNMSCSGGVCTATAAKAVLNINDLTNMLASGDTAVKTGSVAKDIVVKSALSWTSTSRLTLDAQQSVEIAKPMTVAGTGALTITTNDGGKNGEFLIDPKQSVQFWNLASSLIIDGHSYTLVGDIKTLAADIAANPSGFYALAKPSDASADGTYLDSPIGTTFQGKFDGLGNTVSNFSMNFAAGVTTPFGFFSYVGGQGTVRNFGILGSKITGKGYPSVTGVLAAANDGTIESCWASGSLTKPDGSNAMGGLLGANGGVVLRSFSAVKVEVQGWPMMLGGLLGANDGVLKESYSRGSTGASHGNTSIVGGLVGSNTGQVANTYSLSSVHDGKSTCCDSAFGGLVGQNGKTGTIATSYAAGKIAQARNSQGTLLGGLIGSDSADPGAISKSYWDIDKGVSDPGQGAGNVENDPGIPGLTTQQLESGLPKGFDPKTWSINSKKMGGCPTCEGHRASSGSLFKGGIKDARIQGWFMPFASLFGLGRELRGPESSHL